MNDKIYFSVEASRPLPLSPLAVEKSSQPYSTPMVREEMGYAPPPPYFITPGSRWPGQLSDSTASSRGSTSKVDTASLECSNRQMSAERPITLSSFGREFFQCLTAFAY